jgi:HEAT repeat protein
LVACLRLLEEFGHDRHRDALTPFFRCPDFAVRAHSLKALRTVGDTRDLAVFTGALDDESPWVVLEAARGLRALGALEPLQELADAGGARASLAREVLWS